MATYTKAIEINKDVQEKIEFLMKEPQSESEWLGDGVYYCYTVEFEDGYFMDVEICGVSSYEGLGNDRAWMQAVLFNNHCCEVSCSEVEDDFFGIWELEANGKTYSVTIAKSEY